MNLTKKIVLVILLLCLLFSSFYFLLFRVILSGRITEQKSLFAQKIAAGALSIFENENERIFTFCGDWSAWDSMYNYASQPTREFEKDLAADLVVKGGGFSLIVVVNKKKETILLEGYDHIKNKPVPFELLKQEKGPLWDYLVQTFNAEECSSGIIQSEYGPMLLVSSPILHSDDSGPPNGRLMMGRIVDRSFEQRISRTIREDTHLIFNTVNGKKTPAYHREVQQEANHLPVEVEEGKKSMVIRYPVYDVGNQLAFIIRVEARKHMFDVLDNATRLFFLLLIAGFLLLGAVIYFFIHRLVVGRMKRISTTTDNIISFDDLSQRIPETYRDEITQLSRNINKMLKRLETENIRKDEVERMLVLNEKLIFLGKVNATVAHEINNPLFAIANSVRIFKKHLPSDNKRLNDVIRVVEREIKRVSAITQNMYKFTVKSMEKPVPSDIAAIIDAAINVIKWSKQLKETRIHYRKPDRAFPLTCNPDALQQVFMNIILNAVDAMEGKGKLVIRVSADGDGKEYRVDFIDNGPGFDESIKAAMFQSFKSTKAGKGSGLGLNIAYNIIANHGGAITLDDGYRDGAHIIIKIPAKGGTNNVNH